MIYKLLVIKSRGYGHRAARNTDGLIVCVFVTANSIINERFKKYYYVKLTIISYSIIIKRNIICLN
jgi:hypothetical protein